MLKAIFGTFDNEGGQSTKNETKYLLEALDRSQAVIQFKPDGTIITANQNFLDTVGYELSEIQGQHHRMFVEPELKNSKEYSLFWKKLSRGEYQAAEYKRVGKDGKEIWIQASYNPVFNDKGNVTKVVKYATDITAQKLKNADFRGQLNAISKSQAVIEFELDGTILTANKNFLDTVGYSLDEIKGKHHRMFVEPEYKESPEYKLFWETLARGEYQAAEYKRLGKGGKEIWIQATYNPIFDPSGKPYKVVKYATNITDQVLANADYSGQLDAIGKSQAVIEFELDGTILTANKNFLDTVGYDLSEIQGNHHKMFVDPATRESQEYKSFWLSLSRGEFHASRYKRFGKGGKEIWIQASYNPIFDPSGKPFKVVKYATDITEQVLAREESERVGAIVDDNLDKILHAVSDANVQSSSAATASSETLVTVQTVSEATEQFQMAANEIANSMESSRSEVSKAMQEAHSADAATLKLNEAAQSMNSIVTVIQEIASQINLLALNATIESARAGEAGKGFAVVATEVKSLASQVEDATTQISSEIANMQTVSDGVIDQLSNIKNSVENVEQSITTVASAVEEQTLTTKEISQNMQTATQAVATINTNLNSISGAVQNANEYAEEGASLYKSLQKVI